MLIKTFILHIFIFLAIHTNIQFNDVPMFLISKLSPEKKAQFFECKSRWKMSKRMIVKCGEKGDVCCGALEDTFGSVVKERRFELRLEPVGDGVT